MPATQPSDHTLFFERLPEDRPLAGTRPRFAFVALATLALFIAINLGVRVYLDNYTPNFGLWLIRQKWELLLNLKEDQDVLILGDSTADQGLVPEVIQEETGLKAVNLATVANMTFLNDVWMLKAYLQAHTPPKTILIMNSYQMWHRLLNPLAANTVPYFSIPNADEVLVPGPNISPLDRVGQIFLHYLPLYSENESLRGLLRTILQIPPDFSLIVSHHYSMTPLGTFAVYEQDPQDVDEDIQEHLAFLERDPFFSQESLDALNELKNLAAQYDFEIYLINAPIAEEVADSPDFHNHFDVLGSYLDDLASETTSIHYVPNIFSYPREEMESADHMLYDAAVDFTEYIVDKFLK